MNEITIVIVLATLSLICLVAWRWSVYRANAKANAALKKYFGIGE